MRLAVYRMSARLVSPPTPKYRTTDALGFAFRHVTLLAFYHTA